MIISRFTPPIFRKRGYVSSFKGLILMVVMLVMTTSHSFAQASFETIGGLRYLLDSEAKTATLVASETEKYSGNVEIPSEVLAQDEKKYRVVALGDKCFSGCSSLLSVVIPNSVERLADGCFYSCENLKDVVIPNSVKKIGSYCFFYCSSIQKIIIPSSVISLGNNCFNSCLKLSSVSIPSSITSLSDFCFSSCVSLEAIEIPCSVKSLGADCFANCQKLSSLTIPSSVEKIGAACFYYCIGLTSLTIPYSVKEIGFQCFDACKSLKNIYFQSENPLGKDALIPTTCLIYVPQTALQSYKDYFGSDYMYIYPYEFGESDGESKCGMPSISYTDGKLFFHSSTPNAEYHSTITDTDIVSDKFVQDGVLDLSAAYEISVYATADGYKPSDKATATLYWINANLEGGTSTNINQAKTRGIIASSHDGIVSISGLGDDESVSFYSLDGTKMGDVKAVEGVASYAVSDTVVIAKLGSQSIKIAVK